MKRSLKLVFARRILFARLLPLVLLVCVLTGCKLLDSMTQPKVLKSPDGKFEITVPARWRTNLNLHSSAGIQAGNPIEETYLLVMTQPKTDFADDITLDKFTELTVKSINDKLSSPEATPPLPITINGQAGRQYLVQGFVDNLKLSYLITTVETKEHLHRIVTWTLHSRINLNQPTLEKVTYSFRDVHGPIEIGSPY